MVLGIDIDDTISDTFEKIISYAQEFTIDVLNKEPKIVNLNCSNHFYVEFLHGWNDEETKKFFEIYYERIIKEVVPKTLSVKYLKKLYEEGNRIVLITARNNPDFCDGEKITKDWIKQNDIPCDKLILNAYNKAEICKNENIDIFIDDSYTNCLNVSKLGIKTFLMDSKANQDLNIENVERIFSWPHAYMKINNKI